MTASRPTVAEALRAAAAQLAQVSDTARLDAELLLAHALGMSRSEMIIRAWREGIAAPEHFFAMVERRAAHEPVAYIIGEQDFYGRTFRVTPDVLIPRSDSETVIETALAARPDARRVLDCGVGSGCLLVTCLLEIAGAKGIGIDRSQAALFVAENNAQRFRLTRKQARFLLADWSQPGWADHLGQFDLILANPPYVETTAVLDRQVRDFEPAGALFAGVDGLDDYRILMPQLSGLLTKDGVAVLEIGAAQAEAVQKIATNHGFICELRRDLGGRARALILRLGLGKAWPSG